MKSELTLAMLFWAAIAVEEEPIETVADDDDDNKF